MMNRLTNWLTLVPRTLPIGAVRADGRKIWNREDYTPPWLRYHRLNPCPVDVTCELCKPIGRRPCS